MNTTKSLRTFQRTFEQAFRTYHAPYRILSTPTIRAFSIPSLRKHSPLQRSISAQQTRAQSTDTSPDEIGRPAKPLTDRSDTSPTDAEAIAARKALSPAYQLWFTCKKCLERSGHTVSKQAYHFGTCVINCPKCKSQHLISDHLKIFSDTKMTMEDIAKEHGEKLRKGRLGVDGDVEFYDEEADQIVQADEQKKSEQDAMTQRIKENWEK
ncbi:Putative mitochondrial import protein TIM15 [Septoria linicola]|uniref:Mitochondrial import protein TIM15 n=1 Tax=Septoria linicola TaxID=215465 RepID=A0A9Q9B267_9PEZI|nr:putative mitochondrial import protein TIM15 [Septoria linicola]USW55881.1 Putative mitochondrial import protein TIM15 [Septoria linicola]